MAGEIKPLVTVTVIVQDVTSVRKPYIRQVISCTLVMIEIRK